MRILLVEDEKRIASFIERGLKEEDYAVDVAYNGQDALFQVSVYQYDLIVLDRILPDKDGVEVCKEIRTKALKVPVLMLTARSSIDDKVEGLDAGADDYLTKPFAFDELLARIRALLRRKNQGASNLIKVGDLELNQKTHEVKRDGQVIDLTSKEYSLLEYFMVNAGQVITRTMISEHVWNESFDSLTNVIDVYVNYVRNKIDKPFESPLLKTIRGKGYILQADKHEN